AALLKPGDEARREVRIGIDPVGTIRIDQRGRRAVALQVLAMHDGDGDLRAVLRRREDARRFEGRDVDIGWRGELRVRYASRRGDVEDRRGPHPVLELEP